MNYYFIGVDRRQTVRVGVIVCCFLLSWEQRLSLSPWRGETISRSRWSFQSLLAAYYSYKPYSRLVRRLLVVTMALTSSHSLGFRDTVQHSTLNIFKGNLDRLRRSRTMGLFLDWWSEDPRDQSGSISEAPSGELSGELSLSASSTFWLYNRRPCTMGFY